MLNLASTTSLLSLITSATGSIDVVPSWVDLTGTTVAAGGTPLNITGATTTTIVPAPSGTTIRNVKSVFIRNKGAASNTVTVQVSVGGTLYEVRKVTLAPGDCLVYDEGAMTWQVLSEQAARRLSATADQAFATATITAIAGSTLDATGLKVGTVFKWLLSISRNATAGTAAHLFGVHFGTAGTTADTLRLGTYSTGANTAVADVADVEIRAVVRSVSASGTVHGHFALVHNLAATGFAPTNSVTAQSTSAAFDTTLANLKATLCMTPGVASTVTVHQVISERLEP